MLVMAGSFLDSAKKENLTFEEFQAWDRELLLRSRAGDSVCFDGGELDLFSRYLKRFSKKLEKVADTSCLFSEEELDEYNKRLLGVTDEEYEAQIAEAESELRSEFV